MRVVIQRVNQASVQIGGKINGEIGRGLLVFVGIEDSDAEEDVVWLARKITQLRIFDDSQGIMNLSVKEIKGDLLLISQFTLMAMTKKGNRPSYIRASKQEVAEPLYERMITLLGRELGKDIQTGIFGADMKVKLLNDGPVTIWMDTRNKE